MKKLYKFRWDCGRQGTVEGIFIAEEQEVKDAVGQQVNFGEILGKHSEVYGTIDDGEITEIKVSEITVKEMEDVLGSTICGHNPLHHIQYECSRCGDTMRVDDCEWYINDNNEKICEYCATEDEKKSLKQI
jgi:hypothetical protein